MIQKNPKTLRNSVNNDAFTGSLPHENSGERRAECPCFDITDLVGTGREALITHQGETYRLRITSNQKLILTK